MNDRTWESCWILLIHLAQFNHGVAHAAFDGALAQDGNVGDRQKANAAAGAGGHWLHEGCGFSDAHKWEGDTDVGILSVVDVVFAALGSVPLYEGEAVFAFSIFEGFVQAEFVHLWHHWADDLAAAVIFDDVENDFLDILWCAFGVRNGELVAFYFEAFNAFFVGLHFAHDVVLWTFGEIVGFDGFWHFVTAEGERNVVQKCLFMLFV